MAKLSPESIWQMSDAALLDLLNKKNIFQKSRRVSFYAPSFMHYRTAHFSSSISDFPTISVTGRSCALKCRHCGGIVLETMYPATTPKELVELCDRLKTAGAKGCLVSGGCLTDGSVPLRGFTQAIGKVKNDTGLTVFVHSGIVDQSMARALENARVDAVLIDVIGSNDTIKEICGLNVTVDDYAKSLKALSRVGVPTVPHVIVGLHYGKLKGEMHALQMIRQQDPAALVIIAFTPIRGTYMEDSRSPTPLDIARVLLAARLMFPDTPIVLGCMRPKGKHRSETDVLAIKAGADAVAFPTESSVRFAEDNGYRVSFSPFCCSQIYADFLRK